jgi:ribonuclease HI
VSRSASGPDGVPFSFFKHHRKLLKPFIKEAISSITSPLFSDPHFCDAYISLIPKSDNAGTPDKFRPITVTNSLYRIIGKYFAIDFTRFIAPLISEHQHAILPGRSTAHYLSHVRDRFLNSSTFCLLQTDYAKAYDFINREAIIKVLSHINTPPFLLQYISNILKPSSVYLATPNGHKFPFLSLNGVRQGCPISPFIFITVYDIFLRLMAPISGLVVMGGYMDDSSFVFSDSSFLNGASSAISLYERAVGALFSKPKCILLLDSPNRGIGDWPASAIATCSDILGIPTGKSLSILDVWRPTLNKLLHVSQRLGALRTSLSATIRLINKYWVPVTSYIGRFVYCSKEVAKVMANHLRIALGSHNSIPSGLLFSTTSPFCFPIPIRHPVLSAISSIASLDQSLFNDRTPKSPISTAYGRAIGIADISAVLPLNASSRDLICSSNVRPNFHGPVSRTYYRWMSSSLPGPSFLSKNLSKQDIALIAINLSNSTPNNLKISFLRLLTHSWHLHSYPSDCPFCGHISLSYEHLSLCPVVIQLYDCPRFVPRGAIVHTRPPLSPKSFLLINPNPNPHHSLFTLSLIHAIRKTLLSGPFSSLVQAQRLLDLHFHSGLTSLSFPALNNTRPNITISFSLNPLTSPFPFAIPSLVLLPIPSFPFQSISSFVHPENEVSLIFDGSCSDCPSISGGGIVIRSPLGVERLSCWSPGGSNNVAEGLAALYGSIRSITKVQALNSNFNMVGDSSIIVKGVAGLISIENPILSRLISLTRWIISRFPSVKIFLIPREDNSLADRIAFATSTLPEIGIQAANSPLANRDSLHFPPVGTIQIPLQFYSQFLKTTPSSLFSFPSPTAWGAHYSPSLPFSVSFSSSPPTLHRPLFLHTSSPDPSTIVSSLLNTSPESLCMPPQPFPFL